MKNSQHHWSMDIAAFIVWSCVVYLNLLSAFERENDNESLIAMFHVAIFLSYLFHLTQIPPYTKASIKLVAFVCVYSVSTIALLILTGQNTTIILVVILAAILPERFHPLLTSQIILLLQISMFSIYYYYWNYSLQNSLIWLAIFSCFAYFSATSSYARIREQKAKAELEQVYAKLVSTQEFVEQNIKSQELDRISRDLHDMVGHQLTGIILNLNVLMLDSQGETLRRLTLCRDSVKALLNDIRELVRRQKQAVPINLEKVFKSMTDKLPNITATITIDSLIADPGITECLLRCTQEAITNGIRHGNAKHFEIIINQIHDDILLTVSDNGSGGSGNAAKASGGLIMMEERVKAHGGRLSLLKKHGGWVVSVTL